MFAVGERGQDIVILDNGLQQKDRRTGGTEGHITSARGGLRIGPIGEDVLAEDILQAVARIIPQPPRVILQRWRAVGVDGFFVGRRIIPVVMLDKGPAVGVDAVFVVAACISPGIVGRQCIGGHFVV